MLLDVVRRILLRLRLHAVPGLDVGDGRTETCVVASWHCRGSLGIIPHVCSCIWVPAISCLGSVVVFCRMRSGVRIVIVVVFSSEGLESSSVRATAWVDKGRNARSSLARPFERIEKQNSQSEEAKPSQPEKGC